MLKARQTLMAAALGLLAGCSQAPEPAPTFNLAQCIIGLDAATGGGVAIPVGGCVASPAKTYVMVMTQAGALDVMPVAAGVLGAPVWSTASHGSSPGGATGFFQTDGNLVVYDPGSTPIWDSKSVGAPGRYELDLTDQGELLIHDAEGMAIWSSKTGLAVKAAPAA